VLYPRIRLGVEGETVVPRLRPICPRITRERPARVGPGNRVGPSRNARTGFEFTVLRVIDRRPANVVGRIGNRLRPLKTGVGVNLVLLESPATAANEIGKIGCHREPVASGLRGDKSLLSGILPCRRLVVVELLVDVIRNLILGGLPSRTRREAWRKHQPGNSPEKNRCF